MYRLKQDFPALEIVINGGIGSLDAAAAPLADVDGAQEIQGIQPAFGGGDGEPSQAVAANFGTNIVSALVVRPGVVQNRTAQ